MIQTTSPPAASRKWPNTTGGWKLLAAPAEPFAPPFPIQVPSMKNPNPAVMTQVISAATAMSGSFSRGVGGAGRRRLAGGEEAVGLVFLGSDPHAVPVGEFAAECSGPAQGSHPHEGEHQRPPGGGAIA